jgi:hypothetical protein
MTKEKKTRIKKKRNELCYGSNKSPYVLVATIKEKKKTEVTTTTTKKISQLLKCDTPSTTTIITIMGQHLRNKVNILTNEKKKKAVFTNRSIHQALTMMV